MTKQLPLSCGLLLAQGTEMNLIPEEGSWVLKAVLGVCELSLEETSTFSPNFFFMQFWGNNLLREQAIFYVKLKRKIQIQTSDSFKVYYAHMLIYFIQPYCRKIVPLVPDIHAICSTNCCCFSNCPSGRADFADFFLTRRAEN